MKSLLAIALLGAGCLGGTEPDGPIIEPLVADANGCNGTAHLVGANAESATFGPHTFGSGTFCLVLDATGNRYGHLMISSDNYAGEHAPLSLALHRRGETTPLAISSDIVVGNTDPSVFASLEMPIDGGALMDTVLVVEGEVETVTTISVALFERLE